MRALFRDYSRECLHETLTESCFYSLRHKLRIGRGWVPSGVTSNVIHTMASRTIGSCTFDIADQRLFYAIPCDARLQEKSSGLKKN